MRRWAFWRCRPANLYARYAPPKADVGISDVCCEICGFGARPSTVADDSGPTQAMLFVVSVAATGAPSSITAEEAANVWGCGMRGMISPWLVHAPACRGLEQTHAYDAHSAADTFDKRNVRDGHYLAWGYEHLIVKLDAITNTPSSAAQNFVDWVMKNQPTADNAPNFPPVLLEAIAHVIPTCAMTGQRKTVGGPLSRYARTDSCGRAGLVLRDSRGGVDFAEIRARCFASIREADVPRR